MENSIKTLAIVLAIVSTIHAQNFFVGLNIDQNLLNQANSAIIDLSNTLNANINCQKRRRQPIIGVWPGFNLRRGRLLLQERQERHFDFKRLRGFGGFQSFIPQILCPFSQMNNQRNNIFYTIQQKIINVSNLLLKVRSYLIQYNNIIIGSNNVVNGQDNLIIGSRNSLTGNNQWVFASDYHSQDPQNGVLILGVYLIQLAQIQDIPLKPSEVIHCIKQQNSNNHFRNFWNKANPRRRYSF